MPAPLRTLLSILLLPIAAAALPSEANAHESGRLSFTEGRVEIPAFARKYKFSCSVCHAPIPRLTEFGETFAANGFQLAVEEEPRDTIDTGDPMLRLMKDVPLAIRFDGYAQASTLTDGEAVSNDLSFPYGIKLLSGGPIAKKISYYFYFFLSERGEIAGIEDAYLQFSDIGGSGIDAIAGQFQISDPMFKRELRLEFEDYQLYRIRMGDARADLTYDRGVMVPFSPWKNGDVTLGVVNGQGIGGATESRQYDRDNGKNLFARYSHSLGKVRIGVFGLYGNEVANDATDEIWYVGPDASVALGDWGQLNVQYLRRWDTQPFFDAADAPTDTWANSALAEIIWWPAGAGGRWYVTGLWNWIDASDPIVSLRINEQLFVQKYNLVALDASYLVWRNIRFTGEVAWDIEREGARLAIGVVSAF
ncbi:MAG: hypothetical protein Q8W45_05885 [Candidatus Palauibacterales bacterium]|nr:hypothetical protein [Candidatus Palauibacterales bacterium]MDP2482790.1 hypothetical protein [Candidatus Palauibacterales bacterium]